MRASFGVKRLLTTSLFDFLEKQELRSGIAFHTGFYSDMPVGSSMKTPSSLNHVGTSNRNTSHGFRVSEILALQINFLFFSVSEQPPRLNREERAKHNCEKDSSEVYAGWI